MITSLLLLLQNISLTIQKATDLLFLLVIAIVSILIIWALVSIPVWISAKILTMGRAKFGCAMLVTAVGPIVYSIVFFISTLLLSSLPIRSNIFSLNWLALAAAFIAWIYVIKKGFKTDWIRALGISVLAIIVFYHYEVPVVFSLVY
jgi:magnesium-transporting ATPase (P-type)